MHYRQFSKLSWLCSILFYSFHALGCSEFDSLKKGDEKIKVLFVGNSLTYFNELPELVVQEAKRQKVRMVTKMIASPNMGLEDHWVSGQVHEALRLGNIDFLVIQQGPSSQMDGRQSLLEFGGKLKLLCDQYGTKLAFFMVWPAVPNFHTFDGVVKNYTDAAAQTKSILCPVGSKWKEFIDNTGSLSYYSNDQFHPSLLGSQVAAQVIFESLMTEMLDK